MLNDNKNTASILMVGDLILDEPNANRYFDYVRNVLKAGDFVIGHVEVPHTNRGSEQSTDVPAPPSDPENLTALKESGFNMASLAGNHLHDCGREGIEDTIATLNGLGIKTAGAGMNIAEARKPAILEKRGIKVGLVSYNCVGPREGWATSKKAGCAYVRILTHYELEQATPGAPPSIYTFAEPQSLKEMTEDIRCLRRECDILVVALHKGVGHTRAHIDMYEFPVSYAAIDAGADIVIGHHAHIMQGIEIYRGKPIYHGLGNFVTVTHALTPKGNDSPERQAWAIKREKLYGFKPDPSMPFYPFHPESRNTVIAKCIVSNEGVTEAGFIPCYINGQGCPEALNKDYGGSDVCGYVEQISREAGLKTGFEWKGDWVVVR